MFDGEKLESKDVCPVCNGEMIRVFMLVSGLSLKILVMWIMRLGLLMMSLMRMVSLMVWVAIALNVVALSLSAG